MRSALTHLMAEADKEYAIETVKSRVADVLLQVSTRCAVGGTHAPYRVSLPLPARRRREVVELRDAFIAAIAADPIVEARVDGDGEFFFARDVTRSGVPHWFAIIEARDADHVATRIVETWSRLSSQIYDPTEIKNVVQRIIGFARFKANGADPTTLVGLPNGLRGPYTASCWGVVNYAFHPYASWDRVDGAMERDLDNPAHLLCSPAYAAALKQLEHDDEAGADTDRSPGEDVATGTRVLVEPREQHATQREGEANNRSSPALTHAHGTTGELERDLRNRRHVLAAQPEPFRHDADGAHDADAHHDAPSEPGPSNAPSVPPPPVESSTGTRVPVVEAANDNALVSCFDRERKPAERANEAGVLPRSAARLCRTATARALDAPPSHRRRSTEPSREHRLDTHDPASKRLQRASPSASLSLSRDKLALVTAPSPSALAADQDRHITLATQRKLALPRRDSRAITQACVSCAGSVGRSLAALTLDSGGEVAA